VHADDGWRARSIDRIREFIHQSYQISQLHRQASDSSVPTPSTPPAHFCPFVTGSLFLRVLGPAMLNPLAWGGLRSPIEYMRESRANLGGYDQAAMDARASAVAMLAHHILALVPSADDGPCCVSRRPPVLSRVR
jgi:hypothetical protein